MQAIAGQAGVTRQTVSLALRNHPSIPAETRERIQRLAATMGYRPNPLFAALMTHVREGRSHVSTNTIVFLTAHPTRDGWRKRGQIHLEYFDGARARAEELGYRLEEVWAREPGMTGRRLSKVLLTRNIRGLLLAPLPAARGHLTLEWSQFAVATLGYSVWRPDFHRAVANQFLSTLFAIRRLLRLGYRRIGVVVERRVNERCNHQYTAALFDCQQRVPRADRVPPLLVDAITEPAFGAWFQKHRPDAILGNHWKIPEWVERFGRRVPDDVGYVHFSKSDSPLQFTGIEHHAKLVGAAAVDLVVEQLHRNEYGIPVHPKLVMIEGNWVDGETVRR